MVPEDKLTGTVEADKTYIGGKAKGRGRAYVGNKTAVVSLVGCHGNVWSRVVADVTGKEITKLMKLHVAEEVHLYTDESRLDNKVGREFASHDVVNHSSEEYGRFDAETGRLATTNAVEGFFGNSEHSIDGTHHNISKQHVGL